jgi:hypothetical protein
LLESPLNLQPYHFRDDPNVDENTRYRNRIAELESLVRELRGMPYSLAVIPIQPLADMYAFTAGKPHPRWADANFCDGDPNEKWHSRASKRPPGMRLDLGRQRGSFDVGQGNTSASHTPIKSEPGDLTQNFPYRFSPSPDSAQASPYQLFPPQTPGSTSYHEHAMQYGTNGTGGNSSGEGSAGSSSYSPYLQPPGAYHSDAGADPRYRSQHGSDSRAEVYCPCHANPNASAVLIGLSQQLHGVISIMRGLQEHSSLTQCTLSRRIQDLSDLLQ